MLYHVRARFDCSGQAQAASLADDLQKLLDRRSVASGAAVAVPWGGDRWGVVATVFLSVKRDRDTFFENLAARLGQTGGPAGTLQWHDCRHDENVGGCVFTEVSG